MLRTGIKYAALKVVLHKDIPNGMPSVSVVNNTTYFLSLFLYQDYLDFRQPESWIPKMPLCFNNFSSSSHAPPKQTLDLL